MKVFFLLFCLLIALACGLTMPKVPSFLGKTVEKLVEQKMQEHLKRDIQAQCDWNQLFQHGASSYLLLQSLDHADNITDFFNRIAIFFHTFTLFFGCIVNDTNLPTLPINEQRSDTLYNTKDCPDKYKADPNSGSQTDPCCHEEYKAQACCAPRNITFVNKDAFKGWNDANINANCKSPIRIKPYLNLFALALTAFDRGVCTPDVGMDIFYHYLYPVLECYFAVFSQQLPCSSNAACFNGQKCIEGKCVSDLLDLATPMVQCIQANIPAEIERFLRIIWKANTGVQFRTLFLNYFAGSGCIDNPSLSTQPECEAPFCNDCSNRNASDCTSNPSEHCVVCLKDVFPTLDDRCVCTEAFGTTVDQANCITGVCTNWGMDATSCTTTDACSHPCKDVGGNVVKCSDGASCVSLGQCNDEIFGSGACSFSKKISGNCGSGQKAWPFGCVDMNLNQSECAASSGTWKTRAMTQAECEAHGKFCGDDINLSPVFNWKPAVWGKGIVIPTKYVNSSTIKKHVWGTVIKQDELGLLFEIAILRKLAFHIRTSLLCMFNPVIKLLGLFACDCGNFTGSPATCFPQNPDVVHVGDGIAFSQLSGCVKTEKAVVCWKDTTIVKTEDNAAVKVSVVYVKALTDSSPTSKRGVADQYMIIYDNQNQIIGQIVGDAIQVEMKGSGPGQIFADSYEICLGQSSEVPVDPMFTMKDFGYKATLSENFVAQKLTITEKQGKWCAFVNKNGFFAPVLTSNTPVVTSPSSSSGAVELFFSLVLLTFAVLF